MVRDNIKTIAFLFIRKPLQVALDIIIGLILCAILETGVHDGSRFSSNKCPAREKRDNNLTTNKTLRGKLAHVLVAQSNSKALEKYESSWSSREYKISLTCKLQTKYNQLHWIAKQNQTFRGCIIDVETVRQNCTNQTQKCIWI